MLAKFNLLLSLYTVLPATMGMTCLPISILPVTLTQPGHYCLIKDLINNSTQKAITIKASGVVLDLQNHTITASPSLNKDPTYGIYSLNERDITIQNGIVDGFMYGVYLSDSKASNTDMSSMSGGHNLNNLMITNSSFRGIRLEGADNVIAYNTISNTGGTKLYDNAFAIGIEVFGPGIQILNNLITDTHAMGTGESVAISFSNNSSGCNANNNTIINTNTRSFYTLLNVAKGHSFGIWVGGNNQYQTNVFLKNNRISNMDYGITFSSPATGWYSNNLINRTQCDYLIANKNVSTINYKGTVDCGSLLWEQIKEINRILITQ